MGLSGHCANTTEQDIAAAISKLIRVLVMVGFPQVRVGDTVRREGWLANCTIALTKYAIFTHLERPLLAGLRPGDKRPLADFRSTRKQTFKLSLRRGPARRLMRSDARGPLAPAWG